MNDLLANILQTAQIGNLLLVSNRFNSLAYTGHRAENTVVTENDTTSILFVYTTTTTTKKKHLQTRTGEGEFACSH